MSSTTLNTKIRKVDLVKKVCFSFTEFSVATNFRFVVLSFCSYCSALHILKLPKILLYYTYKLLNILCNTSIIRAISKQKEKDMSYSEIQTHTFPLNLSYLVALADQVTQFFFSNNA